jgi:acetolactate synthase I/III small subunit
VKHTLSVLVENKPGVLAKVAGLFARRGFNIHSLAVGPTDDPAASRMTIVVDLPGQPLEQVTKQLHKLISVLKVSELDPSYSVERELMLVKLAAAGPDRARIIELAEVFRAKIIDVAAGALTVEVTGAPDKLHAFEELVKDFDVVELVKTGRVALSRGSQGINQRLLKVAG